MRRIILKTYKVKDLSEETLEVLRQLQRKRIINTVVVNGHIGIARDHLKNDRGSQFWQTVEEYSTI